MKSNDEASVSTRTNPSLPATQCPHKITLIIQNGNFGYRVNDEGHTYDILHCANILNKLNPTLFRRVGNRRAFIVMDPNVHRLYGAAIRAYFEHHRIPSFRFVLPSQQINEHNKDLDVAAELTLAFHDEGMRESDLIVLIGGGVVKDVGAYVAREFRRGVSYIAIPTTLLAIVDAAPSPKCGINVRGRKNLWSAKYYPEAVLYDPLFLDTLDEPAFLDGLAEICKIAIIGSKDLFERLEAHSITELRHDLCSSSAGSMLDEAIQLFLELKWTGVYYGNKPASIRSFGHRFERELETLSGFTLRHGEAVSVEMHVATRLAKNLGFLTEAECMRILNLLLHLNLRESSSFCGPLALWSRVFQGIWADGENFYFPIPLQIGKGGFVKSFSSSDFAQAIDGLSTEGTLAFGE